jgi:hypothetical protein
MADDRPFHITIARQLGSGGSYLAQRLAHRLGFVYLDHQILEQAARELDTSGSELARREERTQSFWTKLLQTFATGCPEGIQSPPPLRAKDLRRFLVRSAQLSPDYRYFPDRF